MPSSSSSSCELGMAVFPAGPQPRALAGSVPRRGGQRSPPDLKREFCLAAFPAGPNCNTQSLTDKHKHSHKHNHKHKHSHKHIATTNNHKDTFTAHSHSTQPQHTTTITAHNPRTHRQSREPQHARPWQPAPHDGMKTNEVK